MADSTQALGETLKKAKNLCFVSKMISGHEGTAKILVESFGAFDDMVHANCNEVVEVRDSPERDIWFLHVVLLGSYQMGRVLGTPPSPSPPPPSSGKCPNIRKCALFNKWACPKNPEMLISGKKTAGGPT